MTENGNIQIKLEKVVFKGRGGTEIIDKVGNPIFSRDDSWALAQICQASGSKDFEIVNRDERRHTIKLAQKCLDAFIADADILELTKEEANLLKRRFEKFEPNMSYPLSCIATMEAVLEQLK